MWGWTHCSPPWVKNHVILIIIILVTSSTSSSRSSSPSLSLSSSSHSSCSRSSPRWTAKLLNHKDDQKLWSWQVVGLCRRPDQVKWYWSQGPAYNHHNYHIISTWSPQLPPNCHHIIAITTTTTTILPGDQVSLGDADRRSDGWWGRSPGFVV